MMMENVGLMRRFAACLYESLSLIAIWLLSTFIFVMIVGEVDTAIERLMLQIVLWLVAGFYFVVCWVKTGQTLAAQAWKIKVVSLTNKPLSIQEAILRYSLASVSLLMFGFGFLWAIVDKEHLFLHDRLLKTRLIKPAAAAN